MGFLRQRRQLLPLPGNEEPALCFGGRVSFCLLSLPAKRIHRCGPQGWDFGCNFWDFFGWTGRVQPL